MADSQHIHTERFPIAQLVTTIEVSGNPREDWIAAVDAVFPPSPADFNDRDEDVNNFGPLLAGRVSFVSSSGAPVDWDWSVEHRNTGSTRWVVDCPPTHVYNAVQVLDRSAETYPSSALRLMHGKHIALVVQPS